MSFVSSLKGASLAMSDTSFSHQEIFDSVLCLRLPRSDLLHTIQSCPKISLLSMSMSLLEWRIYMIIWMLMLCSSMRSLPLLPLHHLYSLCASTLVTSYKICKSVSGNVIFFGPNLSAMKWFMLLISLPNTLPVLGCFKWLIYCIIYFHSVIWVFNVLQKLLWAQNTRLN